LLPAEAIFNGTLKAKQRPATFVDDKLMPVNSFGTPTTASRVAVLDRSW